MHKPWPRRPWHRSAVHTRARAARFPARRGRAAFAEHRAGGRWLHDHIESPNDQPSPKSSSIRSVQPRQTPAPGLLPVSGRADNCSLSGSHSRYRSRSLVNSTASRTEGRWARAASRYQNFTSSSAPIATISDGCEILPHDMSVCGVGRSCRPGRERPEVGMPRVWRPTRWRYTSLDAWLHNDRTRRAGAAVELRSRASAEVGERLPHLALRPASARDPREEIGRDSREESQLRKKQLTAKCERRMLRKNP
jgi:hypothetical protein